MDVAAGVRRGLIAGAAGVTALDAVTYLDMLVRGRPASEVPGRTVNALAKKIGIDRLDADDAKTTHRRSATGALVGYADGVLSGVAYGALRSALPIPWPVGAALLAGLTLLVGEGSAVRAGVVDWSKWGAQEWIADLVPRLAYGGVTAIALETLAE
ncbi:MAG TPA: hypothetical protein VKB39_02425 [Candidatus Baltobacteraceae bacterium]|nr:hypothetical protein [Candidatus Baltobacteraceae bacterium]